MSQRDQSIPSKWVELSKISVQTRVVAVPLQVLPLDEALDTLLDELHEEGISQKEKTSHERTRGVGVKR